MGATQQHVVQFRQVRMPAVWHELKAAIDYLTPEGSKVSNADSVYDLGIAITGSGQFSDHIDSVRQIVTHLCSWIMRTLKTTEKVTLLAQYKSPVLPHLDYCSQLWCADKIKDIQALEMIQTSYVHSIAGYKHLDYWQT